MKFSFNNDMPIYIQLVKQIKVYIVSGEINPGEKLPSVRELAYMNQVNPNTIQKALSELELERLIYTERTNGKFITKDKELIKNVKKKLAEEKVETYLRNMQILGFPKDEAIKCLEKLGGEK